MRCSPAEPWLEVRVVVVPERIALDAGLLLGLGIVAVAWLACFTAGLQLTFDETYYLLWAHHPRAAYLDHPPAVAWLLWPFTASGMEQGVPARLPCWLMGAAQVVFLAAWTREEGASRSASVGTALAWMVQPGFLLGSGFIGPDAPLAAAWAASLWSSSRLLAAPSRNHALTVGACVGAAMLSKFTAVFLVAGLVLLAIRGKLPWRHAAGVTLVVVAVFSPVMAWNASRDWASVRFQASLGARHAVGMDGMVTVADFVGGLLATAGLLVPVAAWVVLAGRRRPGWWPAVSLGVAPLLAAGVLSAFQAVEANWVLPAWLALVPFALLGRPRVRCVVGWSGLLACVVMGAWMRSPMAPPRAPLVERFHGWEDLAWGIRACAQARGFSSYVVLAQSRREATQAWYHLRVPARPVEDRGRFDFLPVTEVTAHHAVLVMDDHAPAVDAAKRAWNLDEIQPCGRVERADDHGRPLEAYTLFAAWPAAPRMAAVP